MYSVLDITDLTRRYGDVVANDRVNLTVHPGTVTGLLGHNGAGKTTLVNQVIGLLKPDSGTIQMGDLDAVANPATARHQVSIQPQAQAPLDGLTPLLAIELSARLRGADRREAKRRAAALVEELDIGEWASRRAQPEGRGLSGGVRRLTSFAMALAYPTPLIILDEPTNDVDAARRRLLWDAIRRQGDQGSGVLVVTHNVAEMERVADDVILLHHGRVVANGSPAKLCGTSDQGLRLELNLTPGTPEPPVPDGLVIRRLQLGRRLLLTVPAHAASEAVTWAMGTLRDGLTEGYSLGPATLEDAYLNLTGSQDQETNHDGQ